jgi:hypothetical protein
MDPAIAAALGVAAALIAAVVAELLRRRGGRAESETNLEITRVDFQREDDEFFPSLDITLRNLSTTSCVITEAEIFNVTTWEFPPESWPSALKISRTYDADLGQQTQSIRLSQAVEPQGVDRFALRLGTSRPLYPYVGYYLYLFNVSLKVNNSRKKLDLGCFLVSIPQPMQIQGLTTVPPRPGKIKLLKEKAQRLLQQVEKGVYVDPVAEQGLQELLALPDELE